MEYGLMKYLKRLIKMAIITYSIAILTLFLAVAFGLESGPPTWLMNILFSNLIIVLSARYIFKEHWDRCRVWLREE